MSRPTTTLLMGTDHADRADRADANRSDSIMLVRTDPERHRIAYLSIPRDLRVDIPGHGTGKINAAFALGGPALAMRTITGVTGIEINHIALVDFNSFSELIDELGGVTVNVPAPIVSNRFDCPFPTDSQCQRWQGWRFAKGEQTMDGRRALIYSRIRENRLNPSENDLTRGERQQAVVQAIGDKLDEPGHAAQAAVRRRRPARAARHRPHLRPVPPARLDEDPLARGPHAPLPARRYRLLRRRRVVHHRQRGESERDRDVLWARRAAAAAAGLGPLRPRLRDRKAVARLGLVEHMGILSWILFGLIAGARRAHGRARAAGERVSSRRSRSGSPAR